ncbi:mitogen-activated protein kinase kinase kinase ANP1-like isoform X1 [Populus nigra]|uniref:mitogen-activated protein kinase kinase kinase ANP1-like isoform X1 n=1 Tax=Populus nigra TaxID=3691 RepID=UPI002B27A0CE|nr:mitogen-activated protein kinase kinase kinase ANP1-like isoform X1 [Populus nigra]
MQDFLGSVRRSIVFRTPPQDHNPNQETNYCSPNNPLTSTLVDKLNNCVRKSRIFNKPTSPSSLPMPPPIRYRKGELIGCGAFGHVYMGMNLDSGELLAIKQVLIAANGATRERAQAHIRELEEEVKLLQNLSHPNIVRYLGTVREEETLNILLEFVPGGSISSLLGKFGSFPEPVIRAYTKQLLLGLEYLHNNGIMHRDIKGANILVDNKGCIKLADFGASKQVVELATVSGAKSMKGTPYWMAPEVILQTGHGFSADIWSVGCTVIEMATGKPPWSQQYQEVAALFYIGSTKSHPEIPGHLTPEAKDFLLKCLHKEPNMRPEASQLLQHPFVTGEMGASDHVIHSPVMEHSGIPLQLYTTNPETIQMPSAHDSMDICNLGSLGCSIDPKKLSECKDAWEIPNSNDDMCLISHDFSIDEIKLNSRLSSNDFNKSSDPKCELSGEWRCKFDESPELEQAGSKVDTGKPVQVDQNISFSCGASLSEDDEELTESKIRAFLGEKALELKKLQTPLYEEFYNSLNASFSPSFGGSSRDETPPNYLKLPPKSKSPSRIPVGSPSTASDAVSTGSPGSNRRASNVGNASDEASEDNSSPRSNDWKGLQVDGQPETSSPSVSFSERQRKWKEELDQELERKREMMRQAAVGSKTSSPKDRALGRQRERTRFASPSK